MLPTANPLKALVSANMRCSCLMERGVPEVDGEPWRDSSQARKLGLKPGLRIALVNCPDGWTSVRDSAGGGPADVIIAVFTEAAEIPAAVPALTRRIYPAGAVCGAWRRRVRARGRLYRVLPRAGGDAGGAAEPAPPHLPGGRGLGRLAAPGRRAP